MKKINKVVSVILSVLLILGSFAVQSVAIFDFLRHEEEIITVTGFEFTDSLPISLSNAKEWYEVEEICPEYSDAVDEASEMSTARSAQTTLKKYSYDLSYEYLTYTFKITLSDGKVIEGSSKKREYDISETKRIEVILSAPYEDLFDAEKNDEKTVPVIANVNICEKREDGTKTNFRFHCEKSVVPSIVKSLTLVSGKPEKVCEKTKSLSFENAVFSYEFYDGTKYNETVVKDNGLDYLNGFRLNNEVNKEKNTIDFRFMDSRCSVPVKIEKCVVDGVYISDYELNENNELLSVTVFVRATDQTTKHIVMHMNGPYSVVNYGSCLISVSASCRVSRDYENAHRIDVKVSSGNCRDSRSIELSSDCNCICHKGGLGKLFYKIASIFWRLLGINKQCVGCAEVHF